MCMYVLKIVCWPGVVPRLLRTVVSKWPRFRCSLVGPCPGSLLQFPLTGIFNVQRARYFRSPLLSGLRRLAPGWPLPTRLRRSTPSWPQLHLLVQRRCCGTRLAQSTNQASHHLASNTCAPAYYFEVDVRVPFFLLLGKVCDGLFGIVAATADEQNEFESQATNL